MNSKSLMVIDPSLIKPEIQSYNHISSRSPVTTTYHLPALFDPKSMDIVISETCGIILMGSASSVYDKHEWLTNIHSILEQAFARNIPTLGICFGHQFIAHMFGGTIDYLWNDEKKKGTRIVKLNNHSILEESVEGDLIYSHREGVTICPSNFEISAKSDMAQIDGITHKSKPIWGFQPHIEATFDFAKSSGVSEESFQPAFQFGTQILDRFLKKLEEVHRDNN
ncbi:gamma-glutamyl-gamma-aminobutyrate hydrolase family protein [Candidatus Marinimicrobia bacterium]|nr:gamma-glutamyl-gamma-aminobutyrate hydrolase family protein [Candidatus Neomarinimicrobiota bacterium]